MTRIVVHEDVPALNFRQRWNTYLALFSAVVALFVGITLRNNALNATTTFEDLESGIRAQIPRGWLVESGSGSLVFSAEDAAATPFKTLLQVSIIPVGSDATPRNVVDQINIERAQQFSSYRRMTQTEQILRDGSAAIRMTYTYAQSEPNPFLESPTIAVEGVDVVILRGVQAVIVTYREERSAFDDNLYRFENLLQTLEIF
ncbi:MAG TPA: hypothetical protein PKD09_12725 [Aggregatilinea sp.]|jgi:hypothetical protein|uniref:hypothetical protein n=1 Tax=Aggregatilinea sp. TaxID=2806333 RepID=UPI002C24B9F5|nr:hypothetical protein [Aggregatilinea sp.]HML22509.1 hypothetical protein [Aggregatilinea sp.]